MNYIQLCCTTDIMIIKSLSRLIKYCYLGSEVMVVNPPNDYEDIYGRIMELNDMKDKITSGCGDFEQGKHITKIL